MDLTPFNLPPGLNPARDAYEALESILHDFRSALSDGEVAAASVVLAGGSVVEVEGFGYQGPCFLIAYGADQHGRPAQWALHPATLQVQFRAVTPQGPIRPKEIGFRGPRGGD